MRRSGHLLVMVPLRIWNVASPGYLTCLMAVLGLFAASVVQAQTVTVEYRMLSESTPAQVMTQTAPESLTGPSPKPSLLEVVYDPGTDLLSIRARHATLAAVLQQISQSAHLTIDSPQTELLDEQVSVEMKDLSLAQALTELLQRFNYAFLYSLTTDTHSTTSTPRLLKVILLSKKAGPSSQVHATKEEPSTESKRDIAPQPAIADRPELIRAVMENDSVLANRLAHALKELETEGEREQATEALFQLLDDQLNQKDIRSYGHALAALRILAPEKILRVLADKLHAEDPTARVVAAASLGVLKDERAIEHLLSVLMGPDLMMRAPAANNLAWIGGPRATRALFRAYFDGDNEVKRTVAQAIATGSDKNARATLATVIARGEGPGGPALHDGPPENGDSGGMTSGETK